jgi:hypothetical protein
MMETDGFRRVMWFVVLESTKNRILGVDTPGQHVPPRVWYGTACLLIRNVLGCASYSIEWGCALFFVSYFLTYFVIYLNHMEQEGPFAGESVTKYDILM